MKIDVSAINGFDAMSADEKVKALLGLEVPDAVDMSMFVSKETADKYASEAADWKKKYNSRLTDEEAKKAAEDAAKQELENKYNALLKKTTIAEYKSKYLAQGYDEKLAEDTANALADGNMDKVFANGEKHRIEMEKRIKAEVLKGTPKPGTAGGNDEVWTREKIMGIKDASERQAAWQNYIEMNGKEN